MKSTVFTICCSMFISICGQLIVRYYFDEIQSPNVEYDTIQKPLLEAWKVEKHDDFMTTTFL